MSAKVAQGIRGDAGFLKHGHTYQVTLLSETHPTQLMIIALQANPVACAASLAVQKAIQSENLLENTRVQGAYLESLLRERLESPNALAAPFTFDIRGGGLWYGIEFDFTSPEATRLKFKQPFAMAVQTRCFDHGLMIMGFTGGSNVEGTEGDHCLLSPAYNVTKEQVEKIVDIFVQSVEEVLKESTV